MAQFFTDTTCFGPVSLGEGIDIFFAGGCSEEGEFFYGEQCGGSTIGPFLEMGLGVCTQPEEECNCNAYVSTKEGGCYTVGTPPGADEQFFMRVSEDVCVPKATMSPTNTCDVYTCDSDLQSAVMDIMNYVETMKSTNDDLLERVAALESKVEELEREPTEKPSAAPVVSPSKMPSASYYEVPSLNNYRCKYNTDERVFTKYGENFGHCIRLCRDDPDCQYAGFKGTSCIGAVGEPKCSSKPPQLQQQCQLQPPPCHPR